MLTKVILLTSSILAFCESAAIIEKVNKKCASNDAECVRDFYRSVLLEAAENGLPDLDVPKLDPLELKNLEIVALGMIKITLVEGTAKGFKSCSDKSFNVDVENQVGTVEYVCDLITVEGNYKIESTPTLLALDGGINVHGEGKGSIEIENIQLNMEFPYELKKLDDGEIHFQMKPNETTYTYEILGKATAAADNIFIGKQEISSVAVNIFNENWKPLSNILGRTIMDKVIELFHLNVKKFFDAVSVKDYITDDLSSYVQS